MSKSLLIRKVSIILIFYFFMQYACSPDEGLAWTIAFPELGSYSSPRAIDLNQDGVKDIVLGLSKNEFLSLEKGVIAISGASGELLWSHPATDQIVGSALFGDITGDSIADVFIGGRKAQLYAINGATGEQVWQFSIPVDSTLAGIYPSFNFYNPQFVPDQNGDGNRDILVSNGGNVDAPPYSMTMRFPGTLLILDSKNGKILNAAIMPDQMETYMSPVVHDFHGLGNYEIIFGTGGETIGGSLFRISLSELLNNDLSKATVLVERKGHGFIAPVSLADFNGDHVLDIVANWHGGSIYVFDGKTNAILHQLDFPETEFNNTAAIGYFNADQIPDIYAYYSTGDWPNSLGTYHFIVDGATGSMIFHKLMGCSSISSGITFDYDNDGFDEIAISINEYDCRQFKNQNIDQTLYLFDLNDQRQIPLDATPKAKNISSTAWVGDLDGDQRWDLVYPIMSNAVQQYEVDGMLLKRLILKKRYKTKPSWGAYMGTDYDGVFKTE